MRNFLLYCISVLQHNRFFCTRPEINQNITYQRHICSKHFYRPYSILLLLILWVMPIHSENHWNILTLSEVENKAISVGFESRSSYCEEQIKEWEKKNVLAHYLPAIEYSLAYTNIDQKTVDNAQSTFYLPVLEPDSQGNFKLSPYTVPFTNPQAPYRNSFTHKIAVSQPVSNGGAEIVAIQIAKLARKAFALQQHALAQSLVYNARKAYFDACAASERTKVSQQDLLWTRQNLVNTQVKFETGNVAVTDVLRWESEVAQKESEFLEAQAVEKYMYLSLLHHIGITGSDTVTLTLQPFEDFEAWYAKGVIPLHHTIETNHTYQALKISTQIAQHSKTLSLTSFLPKLNMFMNFETAAWKNPVEPARYHNDDIIINRSFGAVLQVPIFSGFRNTTNYKKSHYEHMKAQVDEKKAVSQLQINLKRIALFYRASYESVKAAQKQVELVEKNLSIMQSRYDGGLINQSQLLELSLNAKQARIGYIQKLFECLLYETEYKQNTGTLEAAP